MNLCSDEHAEICYEARTCPLCDLLGKYAAVEDELEEVTAALREAEKELRDA